MPGYAVEWAYKHNFFLRHYVRQKDIISANET
jgi:hypothetical protein